MFEVLSFVLCYTISFPGVCPRLCQAWRRSSSSISLCWRSLPVLQDNHCHRLVMEMKPNWSSCEVNPWSFDFKHCVIQVWNAWCWARRAAPMQNLPGLSSKFRWKISYCSCLEYSHPSCHTYSSAHTAQVCWMAYRKYSAMTPGGMSKDLGLKLAGQSKGKKATTLFLVRIWLH